jgi:hypothetical protein
VIDYTFFYLAGFVLLGLFIFIFKYLYKRDKKDAKYYLYILEECDFKDAKKTSLQFSYYGKYIFTDEVTKEKFSKLKKRLKKYKYIQNPTTLPQNLEDNIKQLLQQARKHHG